MMLDLWLPAVLGDRLCAFLGYAFLGRKQQAVFTMSQSIIEMELKEMDLGVVVLLRGLTLRTLVSKPKYSTTTPIRCGYSSVSCNTHDMPRHQRPTHTVQMLHTIIPPHCITAGRENVQNDANQTSVVVIGVRNITTIESTMALNLLFFIVAIN